MRIKIIIFLVFIFLSQPIYANDGSASLAAGGIELIQNEHIILKKETLFISEKKITVDYEFYNPTNSTIKNLVAFPIPRFKPAEYSESDIGIHPILDPIDIIGFQTKINGRTTPFAIELKAYLGDKDVTSILRDYNVPLSPFSKDYMSKLNTIPKHVKNFLEKNKLLNDNKPAWDLKITYFWEQTFPGLQTTKIHHNYQPIVGSGFISSESLEFLEKNYCLDATSKSNLHKKLRNRTTVGHYIKYILKTANTWNGPIQEFELILDKGAKSNILSFCETEIKKISPTQVLIRKKNFVPSRDLEIVLIILPENFP